MLLLASNGLLFGENDCHETSLSLLRQHSTVDNQRVNRSLQTMVLPEMRTRQPGYRARGRLSVGRKDARSGNELSLFFFFTCPAYLFSEKQNSGREKASWFSQHQKKCKDPRPNRKPRKDNRQIVTVGHAAEGIATT